jgi:hypothetical protein
LILVLPGNILIASSAEVGPSTPIHFFESFEDDFIAGRNVPDLVDASLSSSFSAINEKRPAASGKLTIRDRGVTEPGGVGGGFPPRNDNAFLDFTDGRGTFLTFRFSPGCIVGPGSTIAFDVVAHGSDPGSLYKFVSSDGVNFTQVGDASDANGPFSFNLAVGETDTFFRLQVGTGAGIWEGVHVDNFHAVIHCAPVPVEVDIKPGSDPNSINCNNEEGIIPVAILTTGDFDATTVDHTTVTFEGASETHLDKNGDIDLVFHFRLGDTDLTCGSTEGTLTGETFDGLAIEGADAVRMVDQGGGPP